jgi:hypothetical protein
MIIRHKLTSVTSTPFENHHVQRLFDKYVRLVHEAMADRGDVQATGIDPFARECITSNVGKWGHWIISNDLNEQMPTDHHMEANDFGEFIERSYANFGPKVDLVFFDPPYTLRMLKDHYLDDNLKIEETIPLWQTNNMWGRCKDSLAKVIRLGGYVISFGYHTHGFGKHRGFEKKEVLILEQAGSPDRYDLLITVEQKVQHSLF